MPGDGVRCGRTFRGLLAGLPLRLRLVATACCAAAAGAAVMGLACGLAARSALMGQADQQLRAYDRMLTSRPFAAMPAGPGPGGAAGRAFVIEVLYRGQLVMVTGADGRAGPALAAIPVSANQLASVRARAGAGSWLVIASPVHFSARHIMFDYGTNNYFLHVTSAGRPGLAGTLVVGLDLASVSRAVTKMTVSWAAASGAAVLLIAVAGLAVVGVILGPLARAEAVAAGVTAHGLPGQVTADHSGGLADDLAHSLGGVLGQLEDARTATRAARRSAERARSALVSACQELRRPVSVVRGSAEYYRLRGAAGGSDLARTMSRLADEAARMDAIIDGLAATGHDQPPPAR